MIGERGDENVMCENDGIRCAKRRRVKRVSEKNGGGGGEREGKGDCRISHVVY